MEGRTYRVHITWKDAVTTISTGLAVATEWTFAHNHSGPLISNVTLIIVGLSLANIINVVLGFAFDKFSNDTWDVISILIGSGLSMLITFSLAHAMPVYTLVLALSAVAIWGASIIHHLTENDAQQTLHQTYDKEYATRP